MNEKNLSVMNLSKVKELVDDNNGDVDHTSNSTPDESETKVDLGLALKSFLDRIPINSIPNMRSSSASGLKIASDDCVLDSILRLYENNVTGARIVDNVDSVDCKMFKDMEIGFIEFSCMMLWALEEINNVKVESDDSTNGFISLLRQNSQIGQAKIAELTKSFLWEPFFPVHEDDTLFDALLLLSKHCKLNIIPVVETTNSATVGMITQHAVLQLLFELSGLEWFDKIAEKAISEFGFENASQVVQAYPDQSLADSLHTLWKSSLSSIPVVDRERRTLKGSLRCSDLYLLLEDDNLFHKRKTITMEQFTEYLIAKGKDGKSSTKDLDSESCISLKKKLLPQTSKHTTNRKSDSLKQVMESLLASKCECTFLVNETGQLEGLVTVRDIISPFSPPLMDSRIDGGGFFRSALAQVGCHVKNGVMIKD